MLCSTTVVPVCGGLGTLLLLVLLTAHSATAQVLESLRDRLVQMAARWASRTLNGSLDVGALRGSLLSAPVLVDVTLRDAQGDVVAQIAEVRLNYSLQNLLQRRLDIQSVEIIRPQVTVAQDAEGRLNLSQLLASTASQAPAPGSGNGTSFTLEIARLLIRDGQVTVRLPTLPGVQQVAAIQAELRAHVDQAGLRLEVQQGTAQAQPANVALRSMQGSVQAQGGVVRLEAVRLQTTETLLTVDGVLPGVSQAADLSLRSEPLALTEVGRILQQEALQGALYAAVQAEGRRDALRLHGQLQANASTAHLTASGVTEGGFRPDLYHRLAVVMLEIPRLRERSADILLLAQHFLRQYATAHELPPKQLSHDAVAWLQSHSWPGNVRELSHLMERVTLLSLEALVVAPAPEQLCLAPATPCGAHRGDCRP